MLNGLFLGFSRVGQLYLLVLGAAILTACDRSPAPDSTGWTEDATIEVTILQGHSDAITSAAFSPDGNRLVTASADKTARVWSVN